MKPFTTHQQALIVQGTANTRRLSSIAEVALGVTKPAVQVKRHTYIFSPPGVGKTFTVATTAAAAGKVPLPIRGCATMPALIRKLAYAQMMAQGADIVVWIDDCDRLFVDLDSLNVMKGALDEDINMLSWNKNIGGQINRDLNSSDFNTQQMGEAMKIFQQPGSPGVDIPTGNVRFIITSNKDLCAPSQAIVPGKSVNKRHMDEAAIRDRVNYQEFVLNQNQSWGWCASILLSPICNLGPIQLDLAEKHMLLHFMYDNWSRLPSTSMRAVKDLAVTLKNDPVNAVALWEMEIAK